MLSVYIPPGTGCAVITAPPAPLRPCQPCQPAPLDGQPTAAHPTIPAGGGKGVAPRVSLGDYVHQHKTDLIFFTCRQHFIFDFNFEKFCNLIFVVAGIVFWE